VCCGARVRRVCFFARYLDSNGVWQPYLACEDCMRTTSVDDILLLAELRLEQRVAGHA
jgi:hypothetical protein